MTDHELARLRARAQPPAPDRVLVDRADLVSAVAEIDRLNEWVKQLRAVLQRKVDAGHSDRCQAPYYNHTSKMTGAFKCNCFWHVVKAALKP